jgi:hypothetical protein
VLLLGGVYLTEIGACALYCGVEYEWYMVSPADWAPGDAPLQDHVNSAQCSLAMTA